MALTGDTLDFVQGGVVTSSAQIVDAGATVGDVLTVQADKSIAAAPGGGSSPGAAITHGPYPVDYTDFPPGSTDATTLDLLTIPSGDLLLMWWIDYLTAIDWHDDFPDTSDGYMGAGAGWVAQDNGTLAELAPTGRSALYAVDAAISAEGNQRDGPGGDYTGAVRFLPSGSVLYPGPLWISDGTPVQVKFSGLTGNNLTAGHVDVYFMVASPVAP